MSIQLAKVLARLSVSTSRFTEIMNSDDSNSADLQDLLIKIRDQSSVALSAMGAVEAANVAATPTPTPAPTLQFGPGVRSMVAVNHEISGNPMDALSRAFKGEANPAPTPTPAPAPEMPERDVKKADILVYFSGTDEPEVVDPGVSHWLISEVMLKEFVINHCKAITDKTLVGARLVDSEDHDYVMMEIPI